MQGEITAISDGQTVNFSVAKNAAAETLANAGAGQNAGSTGSAVQNQAAATANAGSGNAGGAAGAATCAGSYVLNTNTHKFHVPGCASVDTIKSKNRKDVNVSREQIIREGYAPCKRCNP